MIWGSGGSKSRLAKAAGAEPAGQMRDEKLHAVVARRTFPSQNVQNTPGADHFWKLRCRKSAPRCGAKHISKSKCTKHLSVRPLLEVAMSKKCTPLWREAHLEVNMLKTLGVRTTFGSSDLEKMHAIVARSTFGSQHVKNTRGSDHFWRLRCRFASLHYTTLHYTTLHYTTLHYTTLRSTTLHYINVTSTIVKGGPPPDFFFWGGVCFAIVNRKSQLFPKGFCKVLTNPLFSDGLWWDLHWILIGRREKNAC